MFKSAVIGFFSALLLVGAAYFFGLIGGSDSEPVTVSAPVSAPAPLPSMAPVDSFFGTESIDVVAPEPTVNPEDVPTPPVETVAVDPEPVAQALPPCAEEDSTDCFWDAQTMGNGQGRSFENVGGEIRYTDSDSSTDLPLIREDGWILAEDGTYVNPDFYSETDYTPPASFLPAVREDGWILAEDGTYVNPNFYDDTTPVAPVTIDGWTQNPDGSWLNTDSDSDPIIAPIDPVVPSEPVSAPAPTPAPVTDPVVSEPVNIEPESEPVAIIEPVIESGEIAGEISAPTLDTPVDPATVAPTE